MNTKTCKNCKNKLEVGIFSKDKSSKDGYNSRCKPCDSKRRSERMSRQRAYEKASEARRRRIFKEADYRDYYHRKLGGKVEVPCPAGRIDILTPEEIVEIKEADKWKMGIGQLFCYQQYYPAHKLRLVLLDYTGVDRELIGGQCERLGISLEYARQGFYNPDGYIYFT